MAHEDNYRRTHSALLKQQRLSRIGPSCLVGTAIWMLATANLASYAPVAHSHEIDWSNPPDVIYYELLPISKSSTTSEYNAARLALFKKHLGPNSAVLIEQVSTCDGYTKFDEHLEFCGMWGFR